MLSRYITRPDAGDRDGSSSLLELSLLKLLNVLLKGNLSSVDVV